MGEKGFPASLTLVPASIAEWRTSAVFWMSEEGRLALLAPVPAFTFWRSTSVVPLMGEAGCPAWLAPAFATWMRISVVPLIGKVGCPESLALVSTFADWRRTSVS
jgi:hypothetical protein